MISFIREHLLFYLIGLVIAIVLGIFAAFLVNRYGSTPLAVREQEIVAEEANTQTSTHDLSGLNSLDSSGDSTDTDTNTSASDTASAQNADSTTD